MISIITINRNNAEGLQRTIESVIGQSYEPVDFIVIDGDSTDGSKAVLERYKDRIGTIVSEPDKGIYDAMNKGIKRAKGDYLLFLNSGDYLLQQVLGAVSLKLNTYDVISGNIVIEDEKGVQHRCQSQDRITWRFFSAMSLYHQATFISKKAFDTYGLYDDTFRLGGDYEFFIRLFFKHNASYHHISDFISYFKADGISNSASHMELNKTESQRAWEQNVSKAALEAMREQLAFENSKVHWLYAKSLTSPFYRFLLNGLYALRHWFNRLFKRRA